MSVFEEKKWKKKRKNEKKYIDRAVVFAYNKSMKIIHGKLVWAVRIFLSVACVLAVGFIFYNSMQDAAESAKQSSQAVEVVQQVIATVAPNSPIVTATGAEYDKLHAIVRMLAHFSEFVLLGALAGWCCRAYTDKNKWSFIPLCAVALVAVVDELLQITIEGRAAQFLDVLVDVSGGVVGIVFALLTVWLAVKWMQKRSAHETR